MSFGVAILGMGRWGKAWERVLRAVPDVHVPAVSRSARFPEFSDAIDAEGVDAVVITLPVELHLEAARRAVQRGKHVLCEKPAVPTAPELDELRTVASAPDVVVRICQNYRARGWARTARAAVAEIGSLAHVTAEFAQAEFLDGGRDRLAHPLLADLSIHHLDLLRWLTGREARVLGARTGQPPWSSYRGDADVVALLELDGGAAATYTATWAARGADTPWDGNWRFRGERGAVEVVDGRVLVDRGDGFVERPIEPEEEDHDLLRVWEEFRRAVDDGTADPASVAVPVADHARSLGLVLDIAAAAQVVAPHAKINGK